MLVISHSKLHIISVIAINSNKYACVLYKLSHLRCPSACSRVDLEQNQAKTEVQTERSQREKLAREKDIMTAEMFNLRQQLQVSYFTYAR